MKKSLLTAVVFFIIFSSCGGSSGSSGPVLSDSSSPVSSESSSANEQAQTQAVIKEEPFLFRDMPWGMPREDVIAKEGGKFKPIPGDSEEMLLYQNTKVGGKSADMGIIIAPEYGLTGALYSFRIDTDGFPYKTKPFIDAYSSLYDMLSDIYGSPGPGSQSAKSQGDDLSDYMEYYFMGGQRSQWRQGGTIIHLSLSPKKAEGLDLADWTLSLTYSSPQWQESKNAERKSGL
jgi:hypothetical protein